MILYFSGPHGAGKSSLIKGVCSSNPDFLLYPDRLEFAKMEEPRLRHKSKITKYFQEYCDQLNFEKENPGKIIIGDRCMYDSYAYGRAFVKLGWLSKEDNALHEYLTEKWFENDIKPQHLVVLNPPLESIVERLRKRWEKKAKKWREEDFQYLKAAHEQYKELPNLFTGKNLLYLNKDTTIEDEVNQTLEWVDEKVLEKILV